MVTKRSYILKQTCSFQLQVFLSMCDLFVTTRHYRVKMQISIQPDNQNQRKKMLQPMKTASRKMSLNFQNPSFNILCKITLWNKQNGLNKELIIWSGLLRWKAACLVWQSWKMINLICKKMSDRKEPTQPVFANTNQRGKHVSPFP